MRIMAINFSNRDFGNCGGVTGFLKENLKGQVTVKSFGTMNVNPCGDCNCQCFRQRTDCPFIKDDLYSLYDAIRCSDLVYFIVPNYSDYPCSNYFLFNERGQCYFTEANDFYEGYKAVKKRFIVISNTEKNHFIEVFSYHVNGSPDVLFLSSASYGKRSLDGTLMEAAEARKDVLNFIMK